jgi:hypothetical protein
MLRPAKILGVIAPFGARAAPNYRRRDFARGRGFDFAR